MAQPVWYLSPSAMKTPASVVWDTVSTAWIVGDCSPRVSFNSPVVLMTSQDGNTWTDLGNPFGTLSGKQPNVVSLAYSASLTTLVATVQYGLAQDFTTASANVLWSSTDDGVTWTGRGQPWGLNIEVVHKVRRDESAGIFLVGAATAGAGAKTIQRSTNGTSWSAIATPWDSNLGNVYDFAYNGTIWVAVGSRGNSTSHVLTSSDNGLTWSQVTGQPFDSGTGSGNNLTGVIWDSSCGKFFAVRKNTSAIASRYSSSDGLTWTHDTSGAVVDLTGGEGAWGHVPGGIVALYGYISATNIGTPIFTGDCDVTNAVPLDNHRHKLIGGFDAGTNGTVGILVGMQPGGQTADKTSGIYLSAPVGSDASIVFNNEFRVESTGATGGTGTTGATAKMVFDGQQAFRVET